MRLVPGLTSNVNTFTATLARSRAGPSCPSKVSKATMVSGGIGLAPGVTSDGYTITATLLLYQRLACPPKVSKASGVSGGDRASSMIDIRCILIQWKYSRAGMSSQSKNSGWVSGGGGVGSLIDI